MTPLSIPPAYNYIGVFLTFACNYRCSYCINHHQRLQSRRQLSGSEWIRSLNRLQTAVPVTLQGGEPSLHPDFYRIINELRPDIGIDILTNAQFAVESFMRQVPAVRVRRDAPYASIRVSYHPEVMEWEQTLRKVRQLQDAGYSVGIWSVLHPEWESTILRRQEQAQEYGVDFRTKEFLGMYQGRLYGTYRYPDCCTGEPAKQCECRTTELLIAPDGAVFSCHHHLYTGTEPVGALPAPDFTLRYRFRPCAFFGCCNPCDVKIKTNRFQQFGHTSVSIRNIENHKPVIECPESSYLF